VQARVEMNISQILALLGREGFYRRTHFRHPIQLFTRVSSPAEARMNIRYRSNSTNGAHGIDRACERRQARSAQAQAAQILLAADAGISDDDIVASLRVSGSTVYRTKQRFVLGNLEAALCEEPRPGASRKLTGKEEALLVATACSKPPEGPRPLDPGVAGWRNGQAYRAR